MASKPKSQWVCTECGNVVPRWVGRCSECAAYGTFVEQTVRTATSSSAGVAPHTVSLAQASQDQSPRKSTGIEELDRVLGGGLVSGSMVLIGGEPGVGKSTLLLQAAHALAQSGQSVLYVCGEESPAQIGIRARRLHLEADEITLLAQIDGSVIEEVAVAQRPDILIVDSIQTMIEPEIGSVPGSVSQVRACTARLLKIAKEYSITVLVVGHVTKDGSLAGPRVLEHMVDTVLYFEGDNDHAYRIIRAVKNRFGSISEIGIFEMDERGLTPVESPSSAFLEHRGQRYSGSVLFAAIVGSRPLLVEIQALVTKSYAPNPRRLATGIDTSRLLQVVAVLERRAGVSFADKDVIVSVAGGIRITEPAVDLPLALALISAIKDVPLASEVVAYGEVALTGQVRKAPRAVSRRKEALGLGLDRVISNEELTTIEQAYTLL